ncbi:MAG: murein hydrolase activator EnvC family protein [Candidatus Limnocylindrales bacterium]
MTASTDRRASHRPSRWRWLRVLLAVTLLVPMLSSQIQVRPVSGDDLSSAVAQQQRLNKLIAEQKRQLAQLSASQIGLLGKIATTRSNLAKINENFAQVQSEINVLKSDIAGVQTHYNELVAQVADLEGQLVDLQAQEAAKQKELDGRRDTLARRLVAAYQTDQTSLLEQLLNAKSITDVVSDVSYYMDMGAADQALAEQIQVDERTLLQMHANVTQTRDAVQQLADQTAIQKKQLDAEMTQLNAAQAQLAALQKQTQRQLAQQKAAEAALVANKQALAAAIKANGQAQAQLARKIDALIAAQAQRGRIPSAYSGTLAWPMGGVVTQNFGCTGVPSEPPKGNCAHFHEGIDLAAPCGTQIRSSGSGTVVFVGYNPFDAPPRAWIVIIAHASNLDTWYAHMAPSAPGGVYDGAHVAKGQLIGWEASTGHSTGCHLHWAVRLNGQFVNPRLFV